MLMCATIGFIVGVGLGARFKVFVLVPIQIAWGIALTAVTAAGLISIGQAFQAFAWSCALLQAGYGVAVAASFQVIPAVLKVNRPARPRRTLNDRH